MTTNKVLTIYPHCSLMDIRIRAHAAMDKFIEDGPTGNVTLGTGEFKVRPQHLPVSYWVRLQRHQYVTPCRGYTH